MTDKILIEALEFIASGINADSVSVNTARKALAAHRSRQEAAQEPVGEMRLSVLIDGLVVPVVEADLPVGTKLYTASPVPSESGALRALKQCRNAIQGVEVFEDHRGTAYRQEFGEAFLTYLDKLIESLSASGQK